ncbi:MAG TPA: nucleoside deaminase [Puia sp.]|jgi:tRNA(Arg) A34 adenosine deaminase TadA|nr:nucleoside deaminase [Puia sp.]
MTAENDRKFLREAIELAKKGVEQGAGGPFGCVVVKDGAVVGRGCNQVTSSNDPTAHAEVVAIRDACRQLGSYQLTDCDLYTSCEPCPMCLGAIYWARPRRVVYACTRDEASDAGFDDAVIYNEINVPAGERKIPFDHQCLPEAEALFALWKEKGDKALY